MVKCKDGRKHVIVGRYEKKDGKQISRYERSCPTSKSDKDLYYCCICGNDFDDEDTLREVNIKGETKTICNECVDTIHGLM